MSQRAKLYDRLRQNPSGVHFDELEHLLMLYGFKLKRSKGSHFAFERAGRIIIVARHGAQVHPAAVREALELIDGLGEDE
jgi:predicted RNA binding protein YcfA (HicA-like mRNA interferase family)